MARRQLKSPRSLSGRSIHLTLVTKWSWSWSWMTYCHPLCAMSISPPILRYIKNNAWVTVNNDFLWGNSAMIFTSDEVTSENHWRIASRVTKKSLFTVTNVLFYFLHAISCHEHTDPLRTIIERSFRHCCQARPFLMQHCDVTTINLWHHANAKYWYCDVIFVYCHCTCKFAQRRSSLVNNSREYRYLATRYSRLSV